MKENKNILSIICIVLIENIHVSCENKTVENPRVVIIGAGASGIAAASKLFENGITNVTILEAENRIGGRIYTTLFENYSVDLGAQWIHGQEGNVAYELAHPLSILNKSNELDFGFRIEYMNSDGSSLNEDLSNNLSAFFMEYVHGVEFDDDTTFESIGEYVEAMFDVRFENNSEIINGKEKYLHNMEFMRISSESADSWRNISARGLREYQECPGDQVVNWKEKGYSTILDILMKRYPNSENELPILNNTILNTEVISIDYLNVTEGPPTFLITANGRLFEADHVIVTVSLGVLKKKHKSTFIPPLPKYKVTAIEGIGFGNVAKIILHFEKPFWKLHNERILSFNFVWNDTERKEVENDPEKEWLLGMFGAMTVEYKPNFLSLWITGKYSVMMESLPDYVILEQAVENVERFLGKRYNITAPSAMVRSSWFTNPYFRGTYSYRSLESEKKQVFAEMLERPLAEENLKILFAGEATSKNRFSTVDGAIASGWKAADRLIDYYDRK